MSVSMGMRGVVVLVRVRVERVGRVLGRGGGVRGSGVDEVAHIAIFEKMIENPQSGLRT